MTTANLIVGLDTAPALRQLGMFKSMAEDQMKNFQIGVDLKGSVQDAIKDLKSIKGLTVDVSVKLNKEGVEKSLREIFDRTYELKVTVGGLQAQVQSAVNAGMAGAKVSVNAAGVREAGPGVDPKIVAAQMGAAVSDAVANAVGKAAQRMSADTGGARGAIGFSAKDPTTGARISVNDRVDADAALPRVLDLMEEKRRDDAGKAGVREELQMRAERLRQERERQRQEDAAWTAFRGDSSKEKSKAFDQADTEYSRFAAEARKKLSQQDTDNLKEAIRERLAANRAGLESSKNYFEAEKKILDEQRQLVESKKRADAAANKEFSDIRGARLRKEADVDNAWKARDAELSKQDSAARNSGFDRADAEAKKAADMEKLAAVANASRKVALQQEVKDYQDAEDQKNRILQDSQKKSSQLIKDAQQSANDTFRARRAYDRSQESDDVKNARYRNVGESDEAKRLAGQIKQLELAKDLIEKRNAQGRDGEGVASRRFGSELVQELALLDEKKKRLQSINDLSGLAAIRTAKDKADAVRQSADDFKNVQFANPGQIDSIKRLEGQLRTLAAASKLVETSGQEAGIKRFGTDAVATIPHIETLRTHLRQLKDDAANLKGQPDAWSFGPDFNTLTKLRDNYNQIKARNDDSQVVKAVKYVNPGQENEIRALEAQLKKLAEAQEYVKQGRTDLAIEKIGQAAVNDIPKIDELRERLRALRLEAEAAGNAANSGAAAAAALRRRMQGVMAAAQAEAQNSGQYTGFGARAAGVAAVRERFGDGPARAFINNDELFNQSANLDDHRRRVTNTTEAYRKWREAANDAHSAARGLAGSLGALWVTWGNTAPIVAAAAIGLAVRSAFVVGKDLEYQLQFVSVLAGDAAISLTKFGDAVRGSMVAPVEAAQALRGLAQNGLSAREALQALPAILNLATAGEMSLSEAALGATGVMAAFNLQVSDLSRISDVFAKAAALSNTSVTSMVEAMKQASTVSDQYNVTLEQTAATLATMAKRNIEGSAAGTAFRNMMVELTTPHEKAKKAMAAVGLELYNNSNQLKDYGTVLEQLRDKTVVLNEKGRLTFLNEMFGERGAKAANALLSDFDLYQETLRKLQSESENFSANVARALQETTQGKIRALVTEFQLATSATFNSANKDVNYFIDTLRQFAASTEFQTMLSNLASSVTSLTNFIVENGKQVLITIGAWMGLRALSGLVGGVMSLTAAMTAAGVAANGLRVSMLGLTTAATGGLGLLIALGAQYFAFRQNTFDTVESQKQLNTQLGLVADGLRREAQALTDSNRALYRRIELMKQGKTYAQAGEILDSEEEKRKGIQLQSEVEKARAGLTNAQGVVSRYDNWKRNRDTVLSPVSKEDYLKAKKEIDQYTESLEKTTKAEQDFQIARRERIMQKTGEEDVRRRKEMDDLAKEMQQATKASKGKIKTDDLGLNRNQALNMSRDEYDEAIAEQKRLFNERRGKFTPTDPKAASEARTTAKSEARLALAEMNRERDELAEKFSNQRKIDASLYDEKALGAETLAIVAQNREMQENLQMREAMERWKATLQLKLKNPNLKDIDKDQLTSTLEDLERKGEKLKNDNITTAKVMANRAIRSASDSAREYVSLMDELKKKGDDVATDARRANEKKSTNPEDFARETARLKIEDIYQSAIAESTKEIERSRERINFLMEESRKLSGDALVANESAVEKAKEELARREERLTGLKGQRDRQAGKAGNEAVDSYRRSLTAEAGFDRFWNEYIKNGTDAATTVYDMMKTTTDGMGRAFEQFGATGKFSMKSLINGIISDLGRLAAQSVWKQVVGMVLQSFTPGGGASNPIFNSIGGDISAFAFAGGGVMTQYGNLPLRKYDAGGVARTPQAAIFAEGRKPEAYVPLEDGRTIPVTVEGVGGGGGNTTNVVFSPTINIDSRSDQAQVQMMIGKQLKVYTEQLTTTLKERGVTL